MANKSSPKKNPAGNASAAAYSSLEKYLAFGFIISIIISAGSVLVILLAPLINKTWVPVGWGMIPILVMPFGFACLMALLVLSAVNRKRSSRTK